MQAIGLPARLAQVEQTAKRIRIGRRALARLPREARPRLRAAQPSAFAAVAAPPAPGQAPARPSAVAPALAPPSPSPYWRLAAYLDRGKVVRAWGCTLAALACLLALVERVGVLSERLAAGDLPGLMALGAAVLALLTARCGLVYLQDVWLWEAALGAAQSARVAVYGHLHAARLDALDADGPRPAGGASPTNGVGGAGDYAFRLTAEADRAGEALFAGLQRLVPATLQLVAMATRMALSSPVLTLSSVVLAPAIGVAISWLGARVRTRAQAAQTETAALAARCAEVLPALALVRSHAAGDSEVTTFAALAARAANARGTAARAQALLPAAITVVYALVVLSLLAAGTWAIAAKRLTPGGLLAFLASLVLLIEPIQAGADAFNELSRSSPAVARLLSPLDLPTEPRPTGVTGYDNNSTAWAPGARGGVAIEFDDVHFSYSRAPALCGLTFCVSPGEHVALVGPSGCGKSTAAKLLLRLYEPQSGTVRLGGVPLSAIPQARVRATVALVPQDAGLLDGTIAANIAYGDPHNTGGAWGGDGGAATEGLPAPTTVLVRPKRPGGDGGASVGITETDGVMSTADRRSMDFAAIAAAASAAHASAFIAALPGGLNAPVGPRGSALSGGQRQRVALARAFYRDPRVLVLDEATSGLDEPTAAAVRDSVGKLLRGRTVIAIAHGAAAAARADRVVYLEAGRVVAQGSHTHLLASEPRYAAHWVQGGRPAGSG